MKRVYLLVAILGIVSVVGLCRPLRARAATVLLHSVSKRKTVEDRVAEFGRVADARLLPAFLSAGVDYPPQRLTLVGLKQERQLQVYAAGADTKYRFIKTYRVLAASGKLGPKLREGDGQVPEGIYRIESLNPNSLFHLALRVNYPNQFDRECAQADGRTNLGGDIMIHGSAVSIGCLAMGDEAAEDLFVLAARTGVKNILVILSPVDFRNRKLQPQTSSTPGWTSSLYSNIKTQLTAFPKPQS